MKESFVDPASLALPAKAFGLVVAEPALVGSNVGVLASSSEFIDRPVTLTAVATFCLGARRIIRRYSGKAGSDVTHSFQAE